MYETLEHLPYGIISKVQYKLICRCEFIDQFHRFVFKILTKDIFMDKEFTILILGTMKTNFLISSYLICSGLSFKCKWFLW